MKKVGIIIINWNSLRLGYAQDLVRSLNEITYPIDSYTIFVGDNLSDDGSPDYIEQHLRHAVVVRNEDNVGFAEGNNRLVKRCIAEGFDYVYLLNQDTEVHPDFLDNAVAMMESREGIGAVQSLLLLHQNKEIINSIGNAIHYLGFGFSLGGYDPLSMYQRDALNGHTIAYGSGAAVLLNLEVIQKVGLFDTHFFMYHEDLDLGWRIQMAGYDNVLAYDSMVYHKYEFSKSMEKYYYMERNRYIVLYEHFRLVTLILIIPMLVAFELGTLGFSFISGFWKQKLKVYPYFCKVSSWQRIFQNRAATKKFRVRTDAQILETFSGEITNQYINNELLLKIINPVSRVYFWWVKQVLRLLGV